MKKYKFTFYHHVNNDFVELKNTIIEAITVAHAMIAFETYCELNKIKFSTIENIEEEGECQN